MVEVIYADCDGYIRDNMAISYFVRALPNNHIKYELNKTRPTSLDQAVQSAAHYEFWFGNDISSKPSEQLSDSLTPIAQKNESNLANNIDDSSSIHSVTKGRCTYCGKPHRDGKCITHSRRTPYIKKNGKNKKIKSIDSSLNFHAAEPAKIISVSNQAPAVDTCAVNSGVKFSHACLEGGTNLTGQRHSLCELNNRLRHSFHQIHSSIEAGLC